MRGGNFSAVARHGGNYSHFCSMGILAVLLTDALRSNWNRDSFARCCYPRRATRPWTTVQEHYGEIIQDGLAIFAF
jgi:hypothetical protein